MGLLLLQGSAELNPRELFANGEQGLWLDPSDFSTMWQDSGKTTPVTAAGDPVGYISDKSGRGNNAFQTTSASRPTLARIPSSGRRNLLTRTEEFDNAAWTKLGGSISANQITDPLAGQQTVDLFTEDSGTSNHGCSISYTATAGANTFSMYVKYDSHPFFELVIDTSDGNSVSTFNLTNGTVNSNGTGATGAISALGNGWYRCAVTYTLTAGAKTARFRGGTDSVTYFYAGNGTRKTYIWGAQLETGSTATNYQKVVATTDVTESGVGDLWHLVFDGSDDSLVTNSVDFTGTDEMTVIAGVRKLSDAAVGMIAELTASLGGNNGSFAVYTPNTPAATTYSFGSKGTNAVIADTSSGFAAPLTNVLTLQADISSDSVTGRINAAQVATSSSDQGSGNYSTAAIYIGRRGGTTFPFNGHLYQLIIRGKTTPTGKLLEAERFVGRKTGVSF